MEDQIIERDLMTDALEKPRNHFLVIMRQIIGLFLIALVGGVIWTVFDVWQVDQTNQSNDQIIEASGLPSGAAAYLEGTLVGAANVDSGDYQLTSITQATEPTAILEGADDAWCILGQFNASDATARRISLVFVGNTWSARSAEDILARWRAAGCITDPAPTAPSG